ncbi:MAG: 50S ribosomal protein L11 methyltransferase [Proteobacteria bacterium]|nr:50S ribosomal protein L11 methyltransferase [Pseudomonadota bacterium]
MPEVTYDYFEVNIPCSQSEVDAVEACLLDLGACSVTFRDAQDVAILEPGPGKMPLWQDLEITAMFTLNEHKESAISEFIQESYPNRSIHVAKLQNQVWERTWLEHFRPMQFGKSTWIIPSEFEAVDKDAVNIYLDPGLAFGTGTHATTALCLQWIDSSDLNNLEIMDFGCGSGILAIAALKHGAKTVYCTDIDPQAIESTLANAKNNQVDGGISVIDANNVSEIKNLDAVMANILAAPLLTLVETFHAMLKNNGELIMSGILAEQADEIVAQFSHRFVDFEIKNTEDWISVYARKKSS